MSYTRNFQHIVFRTKCSELTIPEDQKRILLTFLFKYCKRARVYLRRVNASFSVSYYEVEKITNYIKNQEEHHQSTSFEEEFLSLLRVNGVTEDEYVFKD